MSGSLGSLNTALTALRYNRVAMDVASSNIANVSTEGYARRRALAETLGASSTPALWSRSDLAGEGVRASAIDRMTDPFLDVRARREHGNQAYLDTRQAVLDRVETGIGEPGDTGVAAALADFRQGWHDLANNPAGGAARSQLLARATTVVESFRAQARNIATEASDQRFTLQSKVGEVNAVASDLASTNETIAAATLNGTDTGALMDARDRLAMRLAELTGGVATTRADGGLDVTVNGVPLVTGRDAAQLQITSGVLPSGAADGNPVTFSIASTSGTTPLPSGMRGEAGAVTDLLNTTLPAYAAALDVVAQSFADRVNLLHTAGYDKNGTAGTAFFTFTPGDVAGSLSLALTSPDQVAASSVPGGGLDATTASLLGGTDPAEAAYQQLVNGFGTEVASVKRLALNQQSLTSQVDGAQEQISGVSLDEETLNLLAAQHAYEAASRVISTLDSVLDTLINRTGLTH